MIDMTDESASESTTGPTTNTGTIFVQATPPDAGRPADIDHMGDSVQYATEMLPPSEEEKPKRHRFRWMNLSYTARLSLAFAMVSAFTTIAAIVVISVIWGNYFQNYTTENMESLALTTADRIATLYQETGELDPSAVEAIAQAPQVSPDVGVKVLDAQGNVVYESASAAGTSSFEPTDPAQIALAKINTASGQAVGSVRIWVYGSDTLMNKLDTEFRDSSYQALIIVAIGAVGLAVVVGFAFARSLVAPINRLTRTAAAVKAGQLNARSNLRGEDEISHLGETFDAMIASVERDRQFERRITSDVAHELRTPLMSIQTTVEAMIDGVYKTDQEHLEMVDNEVQRLSRLVDALLKLSRLENRSQPIKRDLVDLDELVQSIVATHEFYVTESGLTITYAADEHVQVLGDADMIRQAVVNLMSNAVRYTPKGGRISVTVHRGDTMAAINVADTGIGLTPEEAKMVFSRFWRAEAGRNRESGGLGIGLAVVKEIVDRHNGWVSVDGQPNVGATFTIHLPLYEGGDGHMRTRSQKAARPAKTTRRTTTKGA